MLYHLFLVLVLALIPLRYGLPTGLLSNSNLFNPASPTDNHPFSQKFSPSFYFISGWEAGVPERAAFREACLERPRHLNRRSARLNQIGGKTNSLTSCIVKQFP